MPFFLFFIHFYPYLMRADHSGELHLIGFIQLAWHDIHITKTCKPRGEGQNCELTWIYYVYVSIWTRQIIISTSFIICYAHSHSLTLKQKTTALHIILDNHPNPCTKRKESVCTVIVVWCEREEKNWATYFTKCQAL